MKSECAYSCEGIYPTVPQTRNSYELVNLEKPAMKDDSEPKETTDSSQDKVEFMENPVYEFDSD